jgi:hypothetical protein
MTTPSSLTARQGLPTAEKSWRRFRQDFLLFVVSLATIWLILYYLYPFVRNGAETISATKVAYLESQSIFSPNSRARVLAFGNSKILAGFNPAVYDPTVGLNIESFNAGRPGNNRFLDFLRPILARGTRPTHILVLTPPPDELTWRDYWLHDGLIVNLLFPFRYFPRDLALFVASAPHEGGIVSSYKKNALAVTRAIADRGYFFIKGQSFFSGDRLPDDYRLPTDSPKIAPPRIIDPDAPAFKELIRLAATYGFKVIFIPTPYRTGEVAPPEPMPSKEAATQLPSTPGIYVAGPSRWLFEPRYFSDPVHLNKEGAALYSSRLAEITAPIINGQD